MADLLLLFWVFFRVGLLAFGGSTGVLPELERQIVDEHGWLTHEGFLDSFALGQLTPGPALLMVMFAGYGVAGTPGAIVSLVAIFLPSTLMASLVTASWEQLRQQAWLATCQRALAAFAFGLVAAGTYSILRLAVTDMVSGAIAGGAIVVLWFWRPHPALVILAGGVVAALAGTLGG
ncbi:MAG: chromate transporter [Chloroflexi bacterium]|nr:chromate transporter [Chloroflexota bacterium]